MTNISYERLESNYQLLANRHKLIKEDEVNQNAKELSSFSYQKSNIFQTENHKDKMEIEILEKRMNPQNDIIIEKNKDLTKLKFFESERNLLIDLGSNLEKMSLEEFDQNYNIEQIKNFYEESMPAHVNTYFLVVKVYENIMNRTKTIFCINCIENDFYFNLLHKRYALNYFNEKIEIGNINKLIRKILLKIK